MLDDSGASLGVAGLDLGFDALIDQHLAMPELAGFEASYLLDRAGDIMISSAARGIDEALNTIMDLVTPADAQAWFKHCGYRYQPT